VPLDLSLFSLASPRPWGKKTTGTTTHLVGEGWASSVDRKVLGRAVYAKVRAFLPS